jgi:hypothetical protein
MRTPTRRRGLFFATGLLLGGLAGGTIRQATAHGVVFSTTGIRERLDQLIGMVSELPEKLKPPPSSWEYRCDGGVGHPWESPADLEKLNAFGRAGWELSASPKEGVFCFRRLLTGPSIPDGETGCASPCSASETCFRHTCIAACAPPCPAGTYCSNDKRCRVRTGR